MEKNEERRRRETEKNQGEERRRIETKTSDGEEMPAWNIMDGVMHFGGSGVEKRTG